MALLSERAKKSLIYAVLIPLVGYIAYYLLTLPSPVLVSECRMHLWKVTFYLYRSGPEEYWVDALEENGGTSPVLLTSHGPELHKLECAAEGLTIHAIFHQGQKPSSRKALLNEVQARALMRSPAHYVRSEMAADAPYELFP